MVELTDLAPYTYLVVGVLSAVMAYLSFRSYQNTQNLRLLFVVIAFLAMFLKSVMVLVNEAGTMHPIDHHTEVVLMGLFDVLIVVLFFVPFIAPRGSRNG